MARRVVITGAGAISPLGSSPAAMHAALVEGRSALGPISVFLLDGLGPARAAEVRGWDPRAHLPEGNLRPLDRIGKLVAAAAGEALAGAGWTPALRAEREVGLVLGTMFCGVHTIGEFDRRGLSLGPSYASPMDFANSVINAAAGQTAIWHGLRGVNSTVAGSAASGLQALAYAAEMIADGRAEALLAGGAEELSLEAFVGFRGAGRLCGGGGREAEYPIPFDARRNGFCLGEGAGLLMLESEQGAAERGLPPGRALGNLRGWGGAYDPSRGEDPERAARAVARAVERALATAGVEAGQIDAVWASASGSVAGDRAEARGLAAALGGAPVPVTALKSMLGEGLGAAGALAAIDALETMRDGALAGIAGLGELEEGFPLAVAAGRRAVPVRLALASAAGLDGQVAALVLESAG